MMLSAYIILIFVAYLKADELQDWEPHWEKFLEDFKPNYPSPQEERVHRKMFINNLREIWKHNEEFKAGLHTYTKGINQFADKSDYVLRNEDNGLMDQLLKNDTLPNLKANFKLNRNMWVPSSLDWRHLGAVTPVKYQGHCGSCWTFSTAGAIEAQYFLKTNISISISSQQLVDCSMGNYACKGGTMTQALDDLRYMGGAASESAYPYIGKLEKCKFRKEMAVLKIDGYTGIEKGNEEALKQALCLHGPIGASIQSTPNFRRYDGGVFFDPECTSDGRISHAILIVGYGSENGQDYWLVKNSWSTSWGLDGYAKFSRNKNNHCNIASRGYFPRIKPVNNNQ